MTTLPTHCRSTAPGRRARRLALLVAAMAALPAVALGQDRLQIVTTLPTYAAIVRDIVAEHGDVAAIARGDADPHFVNPRPSYAAMLQRADLFVSTGLDLELWVPALLDRANNPRVMEGAPGHLVAYTGITLLDVPENVSRAGGDVHVFGNPHIHTDPINAILIGRNVAAKLGELDPDRATAYQDNARRFERRVLVRLFGDTLVDLLGTETLFDLARGDRFWSFVEGREYQGRPLTAYLGGWLAAGEPFRDRRMVCYHKNWAYFSHRFRIPCAMYVEPKPGIPASPGHVRTVIEFIEREKIPAVFAANYFSRAQVERVASRTGAAAVIVPEHVGGVEGVDDYFALVETWIGGLRDAFLNAPVTD